MIALFCDIKIAKNMSEPKLCYFKTKTEMNKLPSGGLTYQKFFTAHKKSPDLSGAEKADLMSNFYQKL